MKRYIGFFCILALAASACTNLNPSPVFNEDDAFVAFGSQSILVNEDAGKVTIPLSIASLEPKNVNVSLEFVEQTAKRDTNFRVSGDGVVSFDGTIRSNSIDIEIVNLSGKFTGDLTFAVNIVSAGSLHKGLASTCTITIADLDHPLASILGDYEASGVSAYDGPLSWTATFVKDSKDYNVVWVKNFASGYAADNQMLYANVLKNEDGSIRQIVFPKGQILPYSSSYNAWMVGHNAGGYYYPELAFTYEWSDGAFTFVPSESEGDIVEGWGILATDPASDEPLGWLERFDVAPVFTKK